MEAHSKRIGELVDAKRAIFDDMSDRIWGFAEPRFEEYEASKLQQAVLAEQGFTITADLAGLKTAFVAQWGSGGPVIALLGEFDALPGLSQKADATVHDPVVAGDYGHGCGHNLLGSGTAAAAVALRDYMEAEGLSGTVRYYGCPGEEGGSGKSFLVRDGYFDDCDIAIAYHPHCYNMVTDRIMLANFRVFYTFHGTAAHAAGSPHLGRSALDAVEIMNVGVNYMREHMISDARVHYAVTDTGGTAPNVVQSKAQVVYAIRAPRVAQVQELKARVDNIAEGAALITETAVASKLVACYADLIPNSVVGAQLDKHLREFVPIDYTDEELAYAAGFKAASTELEKGSLPGMIDKLIPVKEEARRWYDAPVLNFVANQTPIGSGSTDVGDVSQIVPTAQVNVVSWAPGINGHSWQTTAQGKSSFAKKGMFAAAKVMAATALDFVLDPSLVQAARAELDEETGGVKFATPLPKGYKPEIW